MAKYDAVGVILLLMLSILSCKNKSTCPALPIHVEFKNVERYGCFDVKPKGTTVIKSDSEWRSLWELYWNVYDGSGNKTPPPDVDFDDEMVIGVFWGGNCIYSGCTNESPSIESVFIMCGTIHVVVGGMADLGFCAACVCPLHLIRIQRHDLPVKFVGNVP